jgi:hypothetical protein
MLVILLLSGCVSSHNPAVQSIVPDYFILHDGIMIMEPDPVGNLYVVDDRDRLMKFDTSGQQVYKVVNSNLGSIHSIDAGNPFKVMAFYRDQQTIILYDNTLSEILRIILPQWKLSDVTSASLSPDNAIWLFEGTQRVLMKMSDQGDPVITSDPFDILHPASARPDKIFDTDHWLVLKESGRHPSLFDDFGNHLRTLEVNAENFTVSGNHLLLNLGNEMRLYPLAGEEEITIPLHDINGKLVRAVNGKYLISDDKGIYAWQL